MLVRYTTILAVALLTLVAAGVWATGFARAEAPPADPARVAMVTALYHSVLGREPDPAGLDGYVASGQTESQIRDSMLGSDECHLGLGGECQRIVMVTALYHSVLGREPDQGGLDGYVGGSLTQSQIRDLMLASDECHLGLGGECQRIAMVSALYRSVLGREPDQGGLDGYVGGSLTQSQIRDLMLASDECHLGLGGECQRIAMVSALYRSVLGREPDQGGLDGYVGGGLTQPQIRDSMLGSGECLLGLGGECQVRVAMVSALYRSVLGREADPGGLSWYLASGLTEPQIHDSMLGSDECHLGLGGECLIRYGHHAPPTITVPADQTVHASGAAGALVTFVASAVDATGAAVAVSCAPASGAMFPIGTTTVTCTAAAPGDPASIATGTFKVIVIDADLTIATRADISVAATSAAGAAVSYVAPVATDAESTPVVSCAPASGSTFAIGTTTVTCTATAAGDANSPATSTFKVTVATICRPGAPGDDRDRDDRDGPKPSKSAAAPVSASGSHEESRASAKDPCAIVLTPPAATSVLPGSHTVTAQVKEWSVAVAGKTVTFTVLTGPNHGITGTAVTNATGIAIFTYPGTTAGKDTIQARYTDSAAHGELSNIVTKTWTAPPSCRDTGAREEPRGSGTGIGSVTGSASVTGSSAGTAKTSAARAGDGPDRVAPTPTAIAVVGHGDGGDLDVAPCRITLTPGTATATLPGSQTFVATVIEFGLPVAGKTVTFTVLTGPNSGKVLTAVTNASGKATFTYAGTAVGKDTAEARYTDSAGDVLSSARVTMTWTAAPRPKGGDKDR